MLQHKLSLSFHIFCQMLFISTATAADSNIYVECSRVHFTRLTPYETNVNSLFSSLVDSASITNFNKFEISQTDAVYGLYQCRGDLESSKCKDCVASSVNQLKTTCPFSVGGSIQLDGCFLKYDNTPFFGVENTTEVFKSCGPSVEYNSDILNSRDDALVNLIAGNGKYFHGGDYGSIRGVAQCVQDLSLSDCEDCLSEASGRLRSQCETSSWGDMFLGKCYIRYHDRDNGHYSNNNSKNDGGGNISKLIKGIIAVAAILFTGASVTIVIKNINCCPRINVIQHFLDLKLPTSVKQNRQEKKHNPQEKNQQEKKHNPQEKKHNPQEKNQEKKHNPQEKNQQEKKHNPQEKNQQEKKQKHNPQEKNQQEKKHNPQEKNQKPPGNKQMQQVSKQPAKCKAKPARDKAKPARDKA